MSLMLNHERVEQSGSSGAAAGRQPSTNETRSRVQIPPLSPRAIKTIPDTGGDRPVYRDDTGYEFVRPVRWPTEERMIRCGIPEKFVYPDTPYSELVGIGNIKARLKKWNGKDWILFSGPIGTGKTTLMAELARRTARRYVWVSFPDMLSEIKLSWNKGNEDNIRSEHAIMREVKTKRLLLLDDLGKSGKDAPFYASLAYEIINYRYIHRLDTVMTTNLKGGKLKEILGIDSFSRIMENTMILNLETQPDFRAEKRKERF